MLYYIAKPIDSSTAGRQRALAHNRASIPGRKSNWRPFKFAWRIEIGRGGTPRRGLYGGVSDTHGADRTLVG